MRATADIYRGDDPRDLPCYTVPEGAQLVGVPVSTLRSWVLGRTYPVRAGTRRAARVIKPATKGYLSFTNLVEAHALAAMRREYQLKLDRIRRAVTYVEKQLGVPNPLARQKFKTDGLELFIEHLGELLNVSRDGQVAMRQAFESRLERVEYEAGRAVRLFPLRPVGTEQPQLVVIDPELAFGRPVLAGTGIPVAVIQQRFKGGESTTALAADFDVGVDAIEEALRAA